MRTVPITILLLAVALAGCAEEAPQTTGGDEEKFEELDMESGKGAIRGIVVDPSITPVEGATVALKGQDSETTSNADGAFVFTDLEPGTYFLEVSRLGYGGAQTSVNVEAGVRTPPIVKVQLVPDVSSLPFTQVTQYTGYLQCGFGIPATPAHNGASVNPCAFTGSNNVFDVPTDSTIEAAQSELFWEGTNALGDGLSFGHYDPSTLAGNYVATDGPSPRILLVNGTLIAEKNGGESTEQFTLRVFPGRSSASLVLEQSFEIINTNFYRFTPAEGWTYLENGAHPVPS